MAVSFRRVLCFLFLVFTPVIWVRGQLVYQFQHLTAKDGLTNSNVSAILKDSSGFLWVGTESGLNRYDGYGFKTYTAESGVPNTLVSNNIFGLQEDGLGNIWIRSSSYMVYNRNKDNFITDVPGFLKGLGIQVDRNYYIYIDKKKDLWVFTEKKAYCYHTQGKSVKVFNINGRQEEILSEGMIGDDGDNLYGILKPGMLWQMNKHTGAQELRKLKGIENPSIHNKIYVDSHGGLWLFSGKSGLVYYKKTLDADWKELLMSSEDKGVSNRVLGVLDDENGKIWIGTDHNGLFIYDRSRNTLTNLLEDQVKKTSLSSNNVVCLYRDDNGIIWIGHNKKGISYYHESFNNVINVNDPECRDVSTIMEDRNGNIWLGTDGNGLFVKENSGKGKIKKLPIGENAAVVSLMEDSKGRIWVGTYLEGLYCFENGKFKRYTKDNSGLVSDDIWGLKEDRYGNIWIGTLAGGVQCLRKDEGGMDFLMTVGEEIKFPLDMYYDGGDKLYIGTIYGLWVVDIVTNELANYYQNKKGTQEFGNWIISNVHKDRNGNIWLGHSHGLTFWDLKKDTLHYFNKDNGLSDNLIRGIIEDDEQNIWVTTSNGLSVLTTERDNQGIKNIDIRSFSTGGLKDNYFNHRSIWKLNNGDILLGWVDGFTMINPNKLLEKRQHRAKVVFTGLEVGNSSIKVDSLYNGYKFLKNSMERTDSLTFRYSDRLIAIQFTTGDLLRTDKVKYAYKLEGFNDEWITIQENRVAFSSLPPGIYKLHVKACNGDGVWNDMASVMNITVTPPFYWSNMAFALYIITAIVLIIYLVVRTRNHHRAKLEKQRKQLEHEKEVHLNEMKLRFFTNVSHDLRTPLTLITTPLQTILKQDMEDSLRKKLSLINKNAEQLLRLINSLLDFRKLDAGAESLHLKRGDFVGFIRDICLPFHGYAAEREISYAFSSDPESLMMQFDSDKVQKIMQNLLSNAFKFTSTGGTVEVHIRQDGEGVYVDVLDTGNGISDSDKTRIFERFYQASQVQDDLGSGIGLHIVNEYVRMHGGTISVKDNVPKGSVFTFMLPITEPGEGEDLDTEDIVMAEIEEETQNMSSNPVLLFVDDNKDFCEFMADSLSDEFTVLIANNGLEALEQLEKNDVNVVISDVMMPVMDGTELCNRIKTNIQWSHIPVILLTARTAEEYQLEGLKMGADDYLTKPFNFDLLRLRIHKFLDWTAMSHASFSQKMDVSPGEITITPLDQQLIEKAIKVVEDHIGDPEFSVEELGSAVGLSRSHLYKKLMGITGKGPAEFIRTIRLKRGRQLLEKSQMQIAEIAYCVGFNSPKRFTINFKNEFGISPSEYLRSIKNLDSE